MNSYLKLFDAITFLWENGKVSRRDLISKYWERFVDDVMHKCCWSEWMFFFRKYPVDGQEDSIIHNDVIQSKIQSAKNERDYKLVKWLAMEKKPIVMEVKYELNNHCRTKIRNSIDQEINWYEDRRDEDGFIRFDFSPLENVYARIWTNIFRYCPDNWMTIDGEYIYWWDKLKEHNKWVINDYKNRMKNYIRLDDEWKFAKVKIDTEKIDSRTADALSILSESDAFISVRNSKK